MAASLPVLTPDWDGLSEALIHCKTGFLVPMMIAGESGIGQDLAQSFADGTGGYLQYLMMIERQTVIVMRACVAALSQLGTKSIYVKAWVKWARVMCINLRWKDIIRQYQGLADDKLLVLCEAKPTTPRMDGPAVKPISLCFIQRIHCDLLAIICG